MGAIREVGFWRVNEGLGKAKDTEEKCPDCIYDAVALVLHKERQHNIVIIVILPLKPNTESPIPHLCPARCATLSFLDIGTPESNE